MHTEQEPRQSLDAVLHAIYGAVGCDALWDAAVQAIAEYLGANIGMLVVMGKGQRDQSFYAAWNHREEVARAYSDHWWQHDILLQTGIKRGMFYTGSIARSTDVLPVQDLRRTAYYQQFMATMPAEHALACVLADGSAPLLAPPMHLSLFRHPGREDFSDADVQALRGLYPHLHRAFELHWQMRHLREQVALFHQSLDGLDFGVLFIDPAQRVQHANARAVALGDSPAHAPLLGGLPRTVPATGALGDLLHACALGQGGVAPLGNAPQRLLALALPISSPRVTGAAEVRASVMLMLLDPARQSGPALDFVVRAFGLSAAQARLLPLLLENLAPAEMAERLQVKISTVRSQLSAIFAKTGTTRQQELIRLLGALPPIHH
ncbi:MAG: hypothetical protein QM569_07400 [Acidovorax sp.]|uniref:helix-turn-helix transcriptional regulator n=1 Tax=Acidovorax sp. TaxID=1872122 RepID=UPI0039E357BD